jgi:Uma2 family endonuclease
MTTLTATDFDLLYPDSDGQPMSDNTKQFRWIVLIKENLEILFAHDPQIFVAGDLLWYPVQGQPEVRAAPSVMVVFGRPKGDRGSYKQWEEENIAPQVVFEILSPGNTISEMSKKLVFYNHYGVEEYYLYDPDQGILDGFIRSERQALTTIAKMQGWVSPRLKVRFELTDSELVVYRPDGTPQAEQERQRTEAMQAQVDHLAARLRELGVDPSQV